MKLRERRLAALGSVLLAVASVALALLIGEIVARVALDPPRYHDAPVELDPGLGFRGVPGFVEAGSDAEGEFEFRLNAEGWRDPAPVAGDHSTAEQIAFFGDSFLVGRGLRNETLLPNQFAATLGAQGTPVEVRNFSVIDYGTAQQLLVFRQVVERVALDGVVLVLYVGNDLVNNEPALAGATDVSAGDYVRPYLGGLDASGKPDWSRPNYLYPTRALLRQHSRLLGTLERGAISLSRQPRFAWLRPFPEKIGQQPRLRRGLAPREALEVLRDHEPGSGWERAWARTFGLVRQFHREVEASGARFLVVVVPMEEQVLRTGQVVAFDWATHRVAGRPLGALLDWELPERRLAAFFREEGIDAVLLRDALREVAAGGDNPYGWDRHLSAAGHTRAARDVAARWQGEATPVIRAIDEPVAWVPAPGDGLTSLDFRGQGHRRYLANGWIDWRSGADGQEPGWRIGPRSLAVVADAGGDVIVEGYAGADAVFPFAVTVEVAGAGTRALRVEAAGQFTLRFTRAPAPARRGTPEPRRYAIVLVGQRGPIDADVRIQRLAIEAAAG